MKKIVGMILVLLVVAAMIMPQQAEAGWGPLLQISLAADTPSSKIVAVGGNGLNSVSEVAFTKIDFGAGISEGIAVQSIQVKRTGGRDADFGEISLWDGNIQLGKSWLVDYKKESTVIFHFPPGARWIIPAGASKTLTVKANVNGIANGITCGAISGDTPALGVKTRGVNAVGLVSCQAIAAEPAGKEIFGCPMVLRKSKPSLAAASLPSTVLTAGEKTLYRWTVTADKYGDIRWNVVAFETSGSIQVGSDNLIIGASNPKLVNGIYMETSGAASGKKLIPIESLRIRDVATGTTIKGAVHVWNRPQKAVVYFTAAKNQTISAGQVKTYELVGSILYSGKAGDAITTRIPSSSTLSIPSSRSVANATFQWTDGIAWANDYLVPGIPTVTLSLSK